MIREVVENSDILKAKTIVSKIDDNSKRIARDLCDTLRFNWSQGRIAMSISANQIGENERIVAISEGVGKNIHVLFNPCITFRRETQEFWEDNLSRPLKMFKTEKAFIVGVKFQNEFGKECSVTVRHLPSALIQQEISNLDGVLPEERATAEVDVCLKKFNPKFLEGISTDS